ncbi:MAG: glycerol-3-phosphate acyltransferase [Anaerolineae bacterium]|jgi:glycerol-3-phosphate acyltransferase PlsY|nr:glycerol-3-phosphate acyltransferase [Anaerolineae bacterium]
MSIEALLFAVFAFLLGSIPFSFLLGKYGLKKDIRQVGDGNPGGFNVLKTGGVAWGGLAIFLDAFKAALPVGLATHIFKFAGWELVIIAVAPVFGHAFSPFLRFKGGKAIASTGGVTIGFSILPMPVTLMLALITFYTTLTSSAWATLSTWAIGVLFLFITSAPWTWLTAWGIIGGLLIYKHRRELQHLPQLKPTIKKRLGMG